MKKIIFLVAMLSLSACATRTVKVVDATWASMKHSMPPSSQEKLTNIGRISEEYCMKEWTGSYGLMDEVVKLAEGKNQIDYIKYPSFTQTEGKSCVQVTGEGYRLSR